MPWLMTNCIMVRLVLVRVNVELGCNIRGCVCGFSGRGKQRKHSLESIRILKYHVVNLFDARVARTVVLKRGSNFRR